MVELRGVLEGFYGRPWSWTERYRMLEFMSRHNFNTYFYGPKNEPLHRNRWREPYLPQEMRRFGEFEQQCREAGVRFVFGLSPLEFHYTSEEDWNTLLAKVCAAQQAGLQDFMLLLDDMPGRLRYDDDAEQFATLAAAQVWLGNRLKAEVSGKLYLCPTEYHGAGDSPYLRELGEKLSIDIEVFWTGLEVCSAVLKTEDAMRVSTTLKRKITYWDNYPVNDLDMRFHPHLRPYQGRDTDLSTACKGIALNAALQAEASKIALHTAAQYFHNPTAYEPEAAWKQATLEVCGNAADAEAVQTLGDLARHNPLEPGQHLENKLRSLLEDFWQGSITPERVQHMYQTLNQLQAIAKRLKKLKNRQLAHDLKPWTQKLEDWVHIALMGLDILEDPFESRVQALLQDLSQVRENFHWVAGDMFEIFARKCVWEAVGKP